MLNKKMRPIAAVILASACAAVLITGCSKPSVEKIRVAVAANFIKPFGEIAAAYESKTGVKIEGTFASSGSLYGQITNGAPYDLFLSADEERPARLFGSGLAESPFVYAKGEVVLFFINKDNCSAKSWREALTLKNMKKIAIANPETAPYGMAAFKAIRDAGLEAVVKPRLVNSQDIAQAFQYVTTGAVDAGFCALSSASSDEGKNGCYLVIKEAPVIVQSACVLKRTADRKAVDKFVEFMVSEDAVKIKTKYSYK